MQLSLFRWSAPGLALLLVSTACDPASDGVSGEASSGSSTGSAGADGSETGGQASTGQAEAGTSIDNDASSSGGEPADCSCYAPEVDEAEEDCLPIDQALPGCELDEMPCEWFSQPLDEYRDPEGAPTPAGAVTCVVQALADGEHPRFSMSTSTYISSDSYEWVPLGDGGYVRGDCWVDDSSWGQEVETFVVEDASYFAECLDSNGEDEAALSVCLLAGFTEGGPAFGACG